MATVSRETVALAPGGLMTVGPCDGGTAGAIVELSLFPEGLGHGQPHLQELRPQRRPRRLLQFVRRGNHGQRPQPPPPRPAEETSSKDQGHFRGDQDPTPTTQALNLACSGGSWA